MFALIAFSILFGFNGFILYFFHKKLTLQINAIFKAFFFGMAIALLIHGIIYGIGKEMNIDFYFFEVRILGKNALQNFEDSYRHFIESLSLRYSVFYTLGVIILPAILEELGKFSALRFLTRSTFIGEISTIRMYIYQMFVVALGFSFLENIFYLTHFLEGGQYGVPLIQLILLRILLSTTSHLLFSGILAYFYARFTFGRYDLIDTGGFIMHKKIVGFLKSIHVFYPSFFLGAYRGRLLMVGFILSFLAHIFYNLMIYLEYPFISFLGVILGWGLFYYFVLGRALIDKNLGLIQEKIALMKDMHRIQKRRSELFEGNEKA